MEHSINEIFQYEERFYKVKEDLGTFDACANCAFIDIECIQISCLAAERQDHKAVVFAECDEFGNELPGMHVVSKTIQDIIRRNITKHVSVVNPAIKISGNLQAGIIEAMKAYARISVYESLGAAEESIKTHKVTSEKNVVLL